MSSSTLEQLSGRAPVRPPVRLVHLGLGAFHRSHQVWHTAVSDPENEWGYASFTGRSPAAARVLAAQDGLYTLVTRTSDADEVSILGHLVDPRDGADLQRLRAYVADPQVAVITLTITEAGYRLDSSGRVDLTDPEMAADIRSLREWVQGTSEPMVSTALGRLVLALAARMGSGAGAITVLPCDNMPANGDVVSGGVLEIAAAVSEGLRVWIAETVAFASSVVDRITPATTGEDRMLLRRHTGIADEGVVIAEPFSEWIISGDFPAGRPLWQRSGARFVADIEPFEQRKLWMLNGAHTLLAVCGRRRGHATVADAMADPTVRAQLTGWWDTVAGILTAPGLDLAAYRASLETRFTNARIVHRLDQIAAETAAKLRFRVLPVLRAARERGHLPEVCITILATWIAEQRSGRRDSDASRDRIDATLRRPTSSAALTAELLGILDARLRIDTELVAAVATESDALSGALPSPEPEGQSRDH